MALRPLNEPPRAEPPAEEPTISAEDVRARVETDLTDTALEALIEAESAEIVSRFGPAATPITVVIPGRHRKIDLVRPLDDAQDVTVKEYLVAEPADIEFAALVEEWWPDVGEVERELDTTDYRIWYGGRTLERLYTGSEPRMYWGSRVEITYTPVSDTKQRREVCMKLVILSLAYDGTIEKTIGDTKITKGARAAAGGSALLYPEERERLLKTLAPRKGLFLR